MPSLLNTTPKYSPEQLACLNIPSRSSQASRWQTWHQSLVACVGKGGANALWMSAWDRYGRGTPASTNTTLIRYMQNNAGIDISQGTAEKMGVVGADISDFFGGYAKFSKVVGMVLTGGIVIGFLMLLYNVIVNPDKAKKSIGVITEGAMMATPQGRLASGATKVLPQ